MTKATYEENHGIPDTGTQDAFPPVDITPEAVEVVAKEIAALGSREAQTMPTGWEDAYWLYDKTAAALRAQAERIAELEQALAELMSTSKAAVTEARNDAGP